MKNIFSISHTSADFAAYRECVNDLLEHTAVQSMSQYTQHRGTEILEHALSVSYLSFRVCRKMGLDYRSAARGGLLHDFFLYQRHVNKPQKGWHTTLHPRLALKNACELFQLNEIERDIIVKHMWPVTISLPKYSESYIVSLVDKYCCIVESLSLIRNNRVRIIKEMMA